MVSVTAITPAYPPGWALGGEVALHRSLVPLSARVLAIRGADEPYEYDGVQVAPLTVEPSSASAVAARLAEVGADRVIVQAVVREADAWVAASRANGAPSISCVHVPPRHGVLFRRQVVDSDVVVYNTEASRREWGDPSGLVLHPIAPPLPEPAQGDAYTMLSDLGLKGVALVADLARAMPDQRFIVVRSHAVELSEAHRLDGLPNVQLLDRRDPLEVAGIFAQTRVLLVLSRYETYGMSAVEAAGYGIPSVHVDTPHTREGVGTAAALVPQWRGAPGPRNLAAARAALGQIESNYARWSDGARARAEWLDARQRDEIQRWVAAVGEAQVRPLAQLQQRRRQMSRWLR